MSAKKPQGFATFSPEQHRAVSRKGGQARTPLKGFGAKSPEERRLNAKKAAEARWNKEKGKEQNEQEF